MRSVLYIILLVLDIYIWLLIGAAILSWLVAFNVVNSRNQVVNNIGGMLYRLTEPVFRPIRRLLPDLGGVEITPIIVLLIIFFLQRFLDSTVRSLFY